jgi:hypothetical protein
LGWSSKKASTTDRPPNPGNSYATDDKATWDGAGEISRIKIRDDHPHLHNGMEEAKAHTLAVTKHEVSTFALNNSDENHGSRPIFC